MVSSISSSSSLMSSIMAKISSSQSGSSKSHFSKTDTDGNGKLSVTELSALSTSAPNGMKASEIVSAADTDGDSELSDSELFSYFSQMSTGGLSGQNNVQLASDRNDMFTKTDTNKDGSLSIEEFTSNLPSGASEAKAKEAFGMIDADGDGALSEAELSDFEANGPMGGGQGASVASSSDELAKILLELIQNMKSTSNNNTEETKSTQSTQTASDTTESDEDKIFSYFDQDSDGIVSDTEFDSGMQSLRTAMKSYMISMQETRAAAS